MRDTLSIPFGVLPSEEIGPMVAYMRAIALHFEAHSENPEDMRALRRWSDQLSELKDELERAEWALGEYANGDTGCSHCGRMRLCRCPNGKHRCEKCNWSPELNDYAPSNS